MPLERQIISSEAADISIMRVRGIRKDGSTITFDNPDPKAKYAERKTGKVYSLPEQSARDFARNLHEKDYVFVIGNNGKVPLLYGPLQENEVYLTEEQRKLFIQTERSLLYLPRIRVRVGKPTAEEFGEAFARYNSSAKVEAFINNFNSGRYEDAIVVSEDDITKALILLERGNRFHVSEDMLKRLNLGANL